MEDFLSRFKVKKSQIYTHVINHVKYYIDSENVDTFHDMYIHEWSRMLCFEKRDDISPIVMKTRFQGESEIIDFIIEYIGELKKIVYISHIDVYVMKFPHCYDYHIITPNVVANTITQDTLFSKLSTTKCVKGVVNWLMYNPSTTVCKFMNGALLQEDNANTCDFLKLFSVRNKSHLISSLVAPLPPSDIPTSSSQNNCGSKWTTEEHKRLVEELKNGMSFTLIASSHKRSKYAIVCRALQWVTNELLCETREIPELHQLAQIVEQALLHTLDVKISGTP